MVASNRFRIRARSGSDVRAQRGQALVETVVACLVLVPLFLLTPIIAKYIHAKQLAQQSARSVAWEATVVEDHRLQQLNSSLEQRRQKMVQRHFDAAGAPILSEPYSTEPDPESRLGNIFLDTLNTGPLVRHGDITLENYQFASGTTGMPPLLAVSPGDTNSLVTARLRIDFQNLEQGQLMRPFDQIDLTLGARQVVLADTWSARGSGARDQSPGSGSPHDRSTLAQINPLAPRLAAEVGGIVVSAVGLLPTVFPNPGRVASRFDSRVMEKTVDEVPVDRLQPYTAPP